MSKINDRQWNVVKLNGLGLRSCSEEEIKSNHLMPASYSMSDNCEGFDPIPEDWDSKLDKTLKMITGFANANDRYLAIISPSWGNAYDYHGCFPKCSCRSTNIVAYVKIAGNSIEYLSKWVVSHIPERF